MPLLELRHVQPDEALCRNKQESIWRQEGRGKGQGGEYLTYTLYFQTTPTQDLLSYSYEVFFLAPCLLFSPLIPCMIPSFSTLINPSHVPALLHLAQNSFFQASTGLIVTLATHTPSGPPTHTLPPPSHPSIRPTFPVGILCVLGIGAVMVMRSTHQAGQSVTISVDCDEMTGATNSPTALWCPQLCKSV